MAVLQRRCEECGEPFEAKSKRAKYCHVNCRMKAHRRPSKVGRAKSRGELEGQPEAAPAKVVVLPTPPAGTPGSEEPPDGLLVAQVKTSLAGHEALDTFAGAAAIRIAQQLDRAEDSGSAVATMTKELSRLMAEARAEAAPKRQDAADDVMARAAEKILRLVQ